MASVVSPELVLVDEELRALALAALPPVRLDASMEPRPRAQAVGDVPIRPALVRPSWQAGIAADWGAVVLLGTATGAVIGYWLAQLH
ncbi:MAG TPA: hypothetical protein VGC78_00475 [Gaiellaceae bacterium]